MQASSRTHQSFTAGFRTHPRTQHPGAAAPAKMAPPPPQAPHSSAPAQVGQPDATVDTRLTQAPPGGRSTPPDTWSAVTSRGSQPPPNLLTDDSYLDVRVLSFRHHNCGFPLPMRNSSFDLASTTYAALKNVGRSGASRRFALDLAFKTPPPLSRDIANSILDLYHNAKKVYNARHAREWFLEAIARARETRTRNRPAKMDSSASDCSVDARQPRHHEDRTSGRGKCKRVMAALTTDSDTGPDSLRGTDRDNRHLRQVFPRVYHAPNPLDGKAPPSLPRIARSRENRRITSSRHRQRDSRLYKCPRSVETPFRTRPPTPASRHSLFK